ncbi:MAG: sugar phosphate nucleotidyltransferase [archaeon]
MAAGMSSRFGGKIKQFAKIGMHGETLMEYSMNQAISAGFTKIIFVVGSMTERPFREMFGNSYRGIPVLYAKQTFNPEERDKPWGTMDALCAIKEVCDCPFVVCNGDDIYGENAFITMAEHLRKNDEEATLGYQLLSAIPEKGKSNRGIFEVKNGYVQSLREVFDIDRENLQNSGLEGNELCSMNCFAMHPSTLKMLNQVLEKFKGEHEGDRKIECLLPAEIGNLIKSGKIKMRVYPTKDRWFGVTSPEDEEIVRREIEKIESGK